MGNEATKAQLKKEFQEALDEANNPDQRKLLKAKRNKKRKKTSQKFGL